jgi:hypothetical protein
LRSDQHALGAVLETQQDIAVIIEAAARHEHREIRADAFQLQSRHGGDEVFRVGADVADRAGQAAARRVRSPVGLLLSAGFEVRRKPALVVFDDDLAHGADRPARDHVAGFAHHGIARVVVRHAEDRAAALDDPHEFRRFFAGVNQRLVAHHVDARAGECACDRKMHVVGRDDGHEVDAVILSAAQFVGQQILPSAVVAVIAKAELTA